MNAKSERQELVHTMNIYSVPELCRAWVTFACGCKLEINPAAEIQCSHGNCIKIVDLPEVEGER